MIDHISSWGWPQWIALAALFCKGIFAMVDFGKQPSGSQINDKTMAEVFKTLLWAALLAGGGFWS